jgi:hypothetical protein
MAPKLSDNEVRPGPQAVRCSRRDARGLGTPAPRSRPDGPRVRAAIGRPCHGAHRVDVPGRTSPASSARRTGRLRTTTS